VPEEAFRDLMPESAASEPLPEQKTPPEEEPKEEQPLDIHILTVGYDQSQLAPIIDALLPGKEAAEETEGK
jgi:hypothetical protein